MARTAVLTKDQIIKAAYDIVNEEGLDAVTIRAVAKRLNKSTAPIYTQFGSIEAIYDELDKYVMHQMYQYTTTQTTCDTFFDIGYGILRFAYENRIVFKEYLLASDIYTRSMEINEDAFFASMKALPVFTLLPDHVVKEILDDMAIYTFGLASQICIDRTGQTLEHYSQKLARNGEKVIHYHLMTSGKYEEIIQLIGL